MPAPDSKSIRWLLQTKLPIETLSKRGSMAVLLALVDLGISFYTLIVDNSETLEQWMLLLRSPQLE